MKHALSIRVLALMSCMLPTGAGQASAADALADWPGHLGPQRNGLSAEKGLLDAWPANGVKEVWRVKGGVGMSGVAVSQGLAITLVHRNDRQKLVALDAATGAAKWETELSRPYKNPMGDGPRATPTIAGDRVFAFTGEGILVAVNLADGKKLWSHDVPTELKGEPVEYGMSSSPLVVEGRVIVTGNSPGAAVVAFDAATGNLAWKAVDEPSGYASPTLLTLASQPMVVVPTAKSVVALSPGNGKVLWSYPWETNFGCNTATPVAIKDQVLISSGENHGSVLLAIKAAGDGFAATKVWESVGNRSVLRSEWQTPLVLGDHLYGFDNVGAAGPVSHLTCLSVATGERAWQQARFGKGNFIAADGKLIIITYDGELVLVAASPTGFKEIGRQPVLGKTRQAPALVGGRIYVRDDQDIVCLDLRKP